MVSSPVAGPSSKPMSTKVSKQSTRSRRTTTCKVVGSLACLAALAATTANVPLMASAAPAEPPGNQVMFGAWLDPADGYDDRPIYFNTKLQQNVAVFQIAQDIPLPPYNWVTGSGGPAPENIIERSGTDAAVFLTVYPANGFSAVTDDDLTALGQQILDYQTSLNRTTFLRYAPEMQGLWNRYGNQPTEFVSHWRDMYTTVKSIAPDTIMVWAPNTPQGYPYGQTLDDSSAADARALDTNGNGVLDSDDDSLAPYYPGDAYVDWIGVSIYYKGTDQAQVLNNPQAPGYCSQAIMGVNPGTGATITNFYTTYCENKPDKACMFAESGAAFHVNDTTTGVTRAELQQAWITDCITNVSFYDEFPRLKMVMHFEYEKYETDNLGDQDFRDFRITNDTAVVRELRADFASMGTRISWANSRAPPTSISSAGAPAATNIESTQSTVVQAITATTRARPTGFPSLFGTTSDGTQLAEFIELGVMMTAGVAGALFVMRTL
ncbi:hypothetical protein OIO90_001316 [Microbotryomycetes sp. JL221]|nr:hypothetical protein OIO90_001316 [Microbotryomycetes sp. JL221]